MHLAPSSLRPVAALCLLFSCQELSLPPPPDPARPGTVSGRVVSALPGRSDVAPVEGASVELLGAGIRTASDGEGFFLLEGIRAQAGQLLLRGDLDRDGAVDRQRLLTLDALRAGAGRSVSVGDVELVANAVVLGRVLRSDVSTPTGHGGTLVVVPQGPFTALTSDDGSFLLPNLPAGELALAAVRTGYTPASLGDVSLQGGQELTLRTVGLTPGTSAPRTLSGRVVLPDGSPVAGATVRLGPTQATTDAAGQFSVADLVVGAYTATVTGPGLAGAQLQNVLVLAETTVLPDIVVPQGAAITFADPVLPDAGLPATTSAQAPLVRVQTFGAGADAGCPRAGYLLQSGFDDDGDGQLGASEVRSAQVVCLAPSVLVSPAGPSQCPGGGGVVLTTWVDANLDGQFQASETEGTPTVLCGSAADGG